MPLTMSELTNLKKYLDAKFNEVNRRFDKNDEEHKGINDHLAKLNGQVAKNTSFRNRYCNSIEKLISDREEKFRFYSDVFWKLILISILILLGLDKFSNVL